MPSLQNIYSNILPSFNRIVLLLSCKRSLHITDMSLLSDTQIVTISPHSVEENTVGKIHSRLLIHFLDGVFRSTMFNLIKSHIPIFPFVAYNFGVMSKKPLPNTRSRNLLMFSFKSCIVLALTCTSQAF